MKVAAIGAGILLLALALMGAGNVAGLMNAAGTITLLPLGSSGVSGTATLSDDGHGHTFITIRASGLSGPATYGFAVMTAHCAALQQLLNPIEADALGDGSSTSQVDGTAAGWWLGILATNDAASYALACGGDTTTQGAKEPSHPATPLPTTRPGGTLVPVTTPTRFPTALPGSTPPPVPGS